MVGGTEHYGSYWTKNGRHTLTHCIHASAKILSIGAGSRSDFTSRSAVMHQLSNFPNEHVLSFKLCNAPDNGLTSIRQGITLRDTLGGFCKTCPLLAI